MQEIPQFHSLDEQKAAVRRDAKKLLELGLQAPDIPMIDPSDQQRGVAKMAVYDGTWEQFTQHYGQEQSQALIDATPEAETAEWVRAFAIGGDYATAHTLLERVGDFNKRTHLRNHIGYEAAKDGNMDIIDGYNALTDPEIDTEALQGLLLSGLASTEKWEAIEKQAALIEKASPLLAAAYEVADGGKNPELAITLLHKGLEKTTEEDFGTPSVYIGGEANVEDSTLSIVSALAERAYQTDDFALLSRLPGLVDPSELGEHTSQFAKELPQEISRALYSAMLEKGDYVGALQSFAQGEANGGKNDALMNTIISAVETDDWEAIADDEIIGKLPRQVAGLLYEIAKQRSQGAVAEQLEMQLRGSSASISTYQDYFSAVQEDTAAGPYHYKMQWGAIERKAAAEAIDKALLQPGYEQVVTLTEGDLLLAENAIKSLVSLGRQDEAEAFVAAWTSEYSMEGIIDPKILERLNDVLMQASFHFANDTSNVEGVHIALQEFNMPEINAQAIGAPNNRYTTVARTALKTLRALDRSTLTQK